MSVGSNQCTLASRITSVSDTWTLVDIVLLDGHCTIV